MAMTHIEQLIYELRDAFILATDHVDVQIDCPEDDDGYPQHPADGGCGCNALTPYVKYEKGYEQFRVALEKLRDLHIKVTLVDRSAVRGETNEQHELGAFRHLRLTYDRLLSFDGPPEARENEHAPFVAEYIDGGDMQDGSFDGWQPIGKAGFLFSDIDFQIVPAEKPWMGGYVQHIGPGEAR